MIPTQEDSSLDPLQSEPKFSVGRLACALIAEGPCVQPLGDPRRTEGNQANPRTSWYPSWSPWNSPRQLVLSMPGCRASCLSTFLHAAQCLDLLCQLCLVLVTPDVQPSPAGLFKLPQTQAAWVWDHVTRPFEPVVLGWSCRHALATCLDRLSSLCVLTQSPDSTSPHPTIWRAVDFQLRIQSHSPDPSFATA